MFVFSNNRVYTSQRGNVGDRCPIPSNTMPSKAPIGEELIRDDYNEREHVHIAQSKAVKRMKVADKEDFLMGRATLSEEEAVEDSGEELPVRP
eukprot:9899608-Lingulodinium_polyedra.AAC.1